MLTTPKVKITGIGVAYPSSQVYAEDLTAAAYAKYKPSPALEKVLELNRRSGIKSRSQIVTWDSPIFHQPEVSTIREISELFLKEGVALSVSAARQAIQEAGVSVEDITHVVATTCTNSSNPGYDTLVAKALNLRPSVERVLLHGVGCSGGLAGLRLAPNLCHTAAWRGKSAHVLVLASEINSSFGRYGLECIDKDQDVRVGVALFGDGAGALLLSLDYDRIKTNTEGGSIEQTETGIFEVINCIHTLIPETEDILRFDVCPEGWKETISPRLPVVVGQWIPTLYQDLRSSLPESVSAQLPTDPADFDWPIHTGGAAVLKSAAHAMSIGEEHLKASWQVYENYGNTSSSSVLAVLDTTRRIQHREWAISMAFGPGLVGEAVMLRRIVHGTTG
ncbi:type Iii polyketide Synthase [Mycena crocata]|nr:type Iii polyketide Synthase [Mycena crocata]